jgi:hypothetical protein
MNDKDRAKIIKARDTGFANALAHLPADKQAQLKASYTKQAERREKNYNDIRSSITGGK